MRPIWGRGEEVGPVSRGATDFVQVCLFFFLVLPSLATYLSHRSVYFAQIETGVFCFCGCGMHIRVQYGLETEVAKHLSENYGDRAWTVCELAQPTGKAWPLHGIRLSIGYPCTYISSLLTPAPTPKFRHFTFSSQISPLLVPPMNHL